MSLLNEVQLDAIKTGFKILFFCIAMGGPATVVWIERNDHWNGVIQKSEAEAERSKNDAIAELNKKIDELGAQHEKDLAAIDDLRRHPVRVQLPCQAGNSVVPQAGGSQLQPSESDRPDDSAQSSFDDFTAGLADDAAEWGKAIAACKVMQEYIKRLP